MKSRIVSLALLAMPLPLAAQVRASELGTVSQVIDGTTITVEYSRPRARGRTQLFGTKFVRWGETWTPGANYATTFEVSKPVKLEGRPVAKGKYSVWMIVRQDSNWTLVLEPKSHLYHMEPPDSSTSQVRIPVRARAAPFTDVLTWSMPEIRMDGGTLAMDWERIHVPISITVEPSLITTLSASDAEAYIGKYVFSEKDSTGKEKVSAFTITHENNTLKGRWTPDDPYMKKFALIRIGPDTFAPGVYDEDGTLYEILKPDLVVEFKRENGKVSSFTIRDMADELWGTGTRKP
jgi:hypothetical protein